MIHLIILMGGLNMVNIEQLDETIKEFEYMINNLSDGNSLPAQQRKLDIDKYKEALHYANGLKRCLSYFK